MTTATPPRPRNPLLEAPTVGDVHPPRWFDRLPRRISTGAVLLVLLAIAAYFHTRTLSGQFWFNEALATGIASHPLSDLVHVLHQSGVSPLYFLLLHFWIDLFGTGETATHALSLLLSLLVIPAAMWTAWSLFGRRAGMFAGILFAFSAYLARYAQDTEMHTLLVLLAVFAVAGFLHGFVCSLFARSVHVEVDVRSERERDAPPRHRRRGSAGLGHLPPPDPPDHAGPAGE